MVSGSSWFLLLLVITAWAATPTHARLLQPIAGNADEDAAPPRPMLFKGLLDRVRGCAVSRVQREMAASHAEYYAEITPRVSLAYRGAHVDCVEYHEQPALIRARLSGDLATLRDAEDAWRVEQARRGQKHDSGVLGASFDDPESAPCPADTVAVVRPRVLLRPDPEESEDRACPTLVVPRHHRAPAARATGPRRNSDAPRRGVSSLFLPAGTSTDAHRRRSRHHHLDGLRERERATWNGYYYDYVDSPFQSVPANSPNAYGVFGVGFDNIKLPHVPADNNSHSLNQLWYLTTYGGAPNTVSLETGWIVCNYWNSGPLSVGSLFVFSTPDGYANLTGPDQYNLQGGFIQFPGTPTLATARSQALFSLMYSPLPNSKGFGAYIRPFEALNGTSEFRWKGQTNTSQSDSRNGTFAAFQPWGYWPMARYTWGPPQFEYFQVGSEMAILERPGTSVPASGIILGWGVNNVTFPIENWFEPTSNAYNATYQPATWQPKNPIADPNAVLFHGRNPS